MVHTRRWGGALFFCGLFASSATSQWQDVVHVLSGQLDVGRGMGHAVSGAGDVNGDGYDDVIVGYRTGAGVAQVYSGSDGSLLHTFTGSASTDGFARSVDGAGDVDGDGFADLIVGAAAEDANGFDSGAAHVFSGRDGALLYHFRGDFARARFGSAVGAAGDVDGDGFADVIVGGLPDPHTAQPSGHARVLSGASGEVLFDFIGPSILSRLGCAVDAAGDVNGDGVPDLVVGDWRDRTLGLDRGSASVFSGSDGSLVFRVYGDRSHDRLGTVVAGVGDVDGDGLADIVAGSPSADGVTQDVGLVRVYAGSDGSALYSLYGDASFDFFGASVAGVGDFDADGVPDIAVGAFADDDRGVNAGSASIFSGADGTLLLRVDGDSASDELGYAVAAAGDVNGDGGADLVIGAPNDDQGGGRLSGSVVVIAGRVPAVSIESYCKPGPNAYGAGARMGHVGTTSLSSGDFGLTVSDARPCTFGMFLFGAKQQQVPFMKGYLCVARPRYRLGRPVRVDRHGHAEIELRRVRRRCRSELLTAGSTWNFQFLYLDRPWRRRSPFNLSDGLTVTFTP